MASIDGPGDSARVASRPFTTTAVGQAAEHQPAFDADRFVGARARATREAGRPPVPKKALTLAIAGGLAMLAGGGLLGAALLGAQPLGIFTLAVGPILLALGLPMVGVAWPYLQRWHERQSR